MSQIAHALAKAKERTGHTTAPFMIPGTVPPPAPADTARATAIRKARNTQRFWLILGVVAIPLIAAVIWMRLREIAPNPSAGDANVALIASSESASSPSVSGGSGFERTSPGSAPKSGTSAKTPAPVAPRTELIQLVAALPISAVMPGEPPRIMLAGRVVRAGQLAEGELTFAGIADGQLRFTDAKGAVYTRYY